MYPVDVGDVPPSSYRALRRIVVFSAIAGLIAWTGGYGVIVGMGVLAAFAAGVATASLNVLETAAEYRDAEINHD